MAKIDSSVQHEELRTQPIDPAVETIDETFTFYLTRHKLYNKEQSSHELFCKNNFLYSRDSCVVHICGSSDNLWDIYWIMYGDYSYHTVQYIFSPCVLANFPFPSPLCYRYPCLLALPNVRGSRNQRSNSPILWRVAFVSAFKNHDWSPTFRKL